MSSTSPITNLHSAHLTLKIPEPPYFLAGAFGGPLVIYVLTPLRNALTLASQDRQSSIRQIYGKVFSRGVRGGWVGGQWPAIPACPQFLVLGPLYHFNTSIVGPYLALPLTGAVETMITFGANARNAEVAHNTQAVGISRVSKFTPAWRFWGPGSVPHACRNTIAMAGMRIVSPPLAEWMEQNAPLWSPGSTKTAADFAASMFTGGISMPFNQLFNYLATTPEAHTKTNRERLSMGLDFLSRQYLRKTESGNYRISRFMLRDLVMRSLYASGLFGIYITIERDLVRRWEERRESLVEG